MRLQSHRRWAALVIAAATVACSSQQSQQSSTVAIDPADVITILPSTTTVTTTTLPATTTTVDEMARFTACVQAWPLRDRIALLVWPGAYSGQWDAVEAAVRDLHVGGVLLMKPDESFLPDLASRLSDLDALSAHGVLVATDEEGGTVQRLRGLQVLPSQEALSAMPLEEARAIVQQHARVVADAGVDVVFGPVADVRPEVGDDPLGHGRLFRGGPDDVATWAQMYIEAWQSVGILPVVKHFPGHGSASGDTHSALAITPSLESLRTRDLLPYVRLANSGAGAMVGHLSVPGLTDGGPASLNPAAVALLRDELGWGDALLVTDSLGMGGVGMNEPDAAVLAVRAGVDVVIFTVMSETKSVIAALEAAVANGSLPEARVNESAARVARLQAAHGRPCA